MCCVVHNISYFILHPPGPGFSRAARTPFQDEKNYERLRWVKSTLCVFFSRFMRFIKLNGRSLVTLISVFLLADAPTQHPVLLRQFAFIWNCSIVSAKNVDSQSWCVINALYWWGCVGLTPTQHAFFRCHYQIHKKLSLSFYMTSFPEEFFKRNFIFYEKILWIFKIK